MVTIVTKDSVPANVITFDNGLLSKYLFLKKDFKEKETLDSDFDRILQTVVKKYIEKEYGDRATVTQFKDILSETADPSMLLKLREILEKKLKDARAMEFNNEGDSEVQYNTI
jgi:hypothetical protein